VTLENILADFQLLDDWEDRYRYVIELGRALPPLPEAARTEANRVRGCASQVWLATEVNGATDGAAPRLIFKGDSDAHIVRGLIAILFAIYSGRCADEIVRTDAQGVSGVSGWPST
jgi:cysteine desulfuration protein SufE